MTPKYLISVDPGVQGSGVCYWIDGKLTHSEYRNKPVDWAHTTVVVCELMKVYPGARHAADLIDVSFAAGVVCAHYPNVIKVPAAEWAGQVPKKIRHERLKKELHPETIRTIESSKCIPSLMHNIWDAVGIGVWYLKTQNAWSSRPGAGN